MLFNRKMHHYQALPPKNAPDAPRKTIRLKVACLKQSQ